jgi:DNA-binding NarL/FixJ family response regulator
VKTDSSNPVRILIADGRVVARQVLSALLASQFNWEVCGEAGDGEETIEKVGKLRPDIVVIDIDLPNLGGLEVARRIACSHPDQKSIILTGSDDPEVTRKIFAASAYGFVLQENAVQNLVLAIERVSVGKTCYTAKAAGAVLQSCLHSSTRETELTDRQQEILKLLANECASPYASSHNRHPHRRRRSKIAAVAGAGLLSLALMYAINVNFFGQPLLSLGLKKVSAQMSRGNPETRVWIDLRTALYYCPGEPQYSRHSKGTFARQIEAQRDHFEPASRKPCQ